MFTLRLWKKGGMIFLAGLLLMACGCTNSMDSALSEEVSTQEEEIQTEKAMTDFTAKGLALPEDFGLTAYPMQAVMVEYYTQGLPYYREGEEATSFWFSMAVLSSMLEEDGILEPVSEQEYSFYPEEDIREFASVLYSRYGEGKMKIPDIRDDVPYVCYDEVTDRYGLLNGNIGDLGMMITRCQPDNSGYLFFTQLMDLESGDVLAEFRIPVVHREDKKGKGSFPYAIAGLDEITGRDAAVEEEVQEESTRLAEEMQESAQTKEAESAENAACGESGKIGQKEALALARTFLGENSVCTFRQMVTMYDRDYYDFTVTGENLSSTDILVCLDGSDVFTGVQNEDGSWTIDP